MEKISTEKGIEVFEFYTNFLEDAKLSPVTKANSLHDMILGWSYIDVITNEQFDELNNWVSEWFKKELNKIGEKDND